MLPPGACIRTVICPWRAKAKQNRSEFKTHEIKPVHAAWGVMRKRYGRA